MTSAAGRPRIIFMGSPDFAVPSLEALERRHEVLAVVTQPDRRQGRGRKLSPPPVKVAAHRLGLSVLQPEKFRRRSVREQLTALGADVFVVVAFGNILSPRMLAVPPMGCVNVHASLLPGFRGAAPIHRAVIDGAGRSGVTIMQMDRGMDTGPMLVQGSVDLDPDETAGSLHDKLAPLGANLLIQALDGMMDGSLNSTPQPEAGVSLAPMLTKQDGLVDFTMPGRRVDCLIRGMDPWPGAYTTFEDRRLKLFNSSLAPGYSGCCPGEVVCVDGRGLLVACGDDDGVCIKDLQLPGRRCMSAGALSAGCTMPSGTVLGRPGRSTE